MQRNSIKAVSRAEGDFSSKRTQSSEQFFRKISTHSSGRELPPPITNNLVYDHSFELIEHSGAIDATHQDFATTLGTPVTTTWFRVGTPRIFSERGSSLGEKYVLFGKQSMVCDINNYVRQRIRVQPNTTYTISFYCFPHPTRNVSGNPARQYLQLQYYTAALGLISQEDKGADLEPVTPATVVEDQIRVVQTFTTPATTNLVEIRLRGSSVVPTWVVYDGVQVLEGIHSGMYEPENQVYDMARRGVI